MPITRLSMLRWGLAFPAAAAVARCAVAEPSALAMEIPFDMPGYTEPTFPDRTFPITDFGAELRFSDTFDDYLPVVYI